MASAYFIEMIDAGHIGTLLHFAPDTTEDRERKEVADCSNSGPLSQFFGDVLCNRRTIPGTPKPHEMVEGIAFDVFLAVWGDPGETWVATAASRLLTSGASQVLAVDILDFVAQQNLRNLPSATFVLSRITGIHSRVGLWRSADARFVARGHDRARFLSQDEILDQLRGTREIIWRELTAPSDLGWQGIPACFEAVAASADRPAEFVDMRWRVWAKIDTGKSESTLTGHAMPNDPEAAQVIRISHEDVQSAHVEDLLRRQLSLRGERGITASRPRRWFYQSWFILMLAGGAMAFTAWACIEPFFGDLIYLQGTIANVNASEGAPKRFSAGSREMVLNAPTRGWVQIGDQRIYLIESAKLYSGGKSTPLNLADLRVGQEIGIYVEAIDADSGFVVLGAYVTPSPKPQSPSRAAMALSQLKAQKTAAALLLFPLVAGFVGFGVGAIDGIVCRLPRRALFSGAIGLIVGLLGGFISTMLAGLVYSPLNHLAMQQAGFNAEHLTPFAFFVQMTGRGLAWLLAGMAMGLGQGIALRSTRLLLYGFVGGMVGGLLGGLLFDPIDLVALGGDKPSAYIARMIGLTVIGVSVGAMIGVVELLARDTWLRMTEGPLAGKEFLLFKDIMRIGSSSRCDIYLFNDPQVAPQHATVRFVGDQSEIDSVAPDNMVLVNDRPVRHARLRHGDQITIGRTVFVFQSQKG